MWRKGRERFFSFSSGMGNESRHILHNFNSQHSTPWLELLLQLSKFWKATGSPHLNWASTVFISFHSIHAQENV